MTKLITLFVLGLLDCLAFLTSVAVLILLLILLLLHFLQPVGGSLTPSTWVWVCIVLTMNSGYFILRGMTDKETE
jgi:hypothetical protein